MFGFPGDCRFSFFGKLYKYTAKITRAAPTTNSTVKWKFKIIIAAIVDTIIEIDVANPFNILSAYLMTTATKSPPVALMKTTNHTRPLYPKKKPFSTIEDPSEVYAPRSPASMPKILNWTFRSQTDPLLPFSIFSKYTPANPDEMHDSITAISPFSGFWSLLDALSDFFCVSTCKKKFLNSFIFWTYL